MDDGILLGYSSKSKAYKCYNLRLNKIVESINVKFDDNPQEPRNTRNIIEAEDDIAETKLPFEDESWTKEPMEPVLQSPPGNNQTPSRAWRQSPSVRIQTPTGEARLSHKTTTRYVQKNHPAKQVIGDEDVGVETRSRKQFQSPE